MPYLTLCHATCITREEYPVVANSSISYKHKFLYLSGKKEWSTMQDFSVSFLMLPNLTLPFPSTPRYETYRICTIFRIVTNFSEKIPYSYKIISSNLFKLSSLSTGVVHPWLISFKKWQKILSPLPMTILFQLYLLLIIKLFLHSTYHLSPLYIICLHH